MNFWGKTLRTLILSNGLQKKIVMKPVKSYWKHFQINVKIIFTNIEDERFNFGNKTNYIMTNG